MERKILFKAKRLDNGEWVTGSLLLSEKGKACIGTMLDSNEENGSPVCFQCKEVDPSTVCQFTGLKDMNNVDIYEHDLIYNSDWDDKEHEIIFYKGVFMLNGIPLSEYILFEENVIYLQNQGSKFNRKEGEK